VTAATETPLISGIDHVVIGVRDIDSGISAYERLLDHSVGHRYERDGVATALIALPGFAVEIMAPASAGETAARLGAALDRDGEGLKSIVFAVADIERAHTRAARVGLEPDDIANGAANDLRWRRFRANGERTLRLRVFFIQREAPLKLGAASDVQGLDHIVVRARDMEQAAALFGARLGLDMRLDRTIAERRMMFFRCGGAIVEIVEDEDAETRAWGLSWRVADADVSRARLAASGVAVSAVRPGMKPATRVFTVRDGSCGVPTLMIELSPKRD